jgi:acyl carrier protein
MTDRETIRQTVLELYEAETGKTAPSLSDALNLKDELGLDSVDLVGIVMQLENRFRIRLTHQDLEKVVCVGDLLNLLEAKVSAVPESSAA